MIDKIKKMMGGEKEEAAPTITIQPTPIRPVAGAGKPGPLTNIFRGFGKAIK